MVIAGCATGIKQDSPPLSGRFHSQREKPLIVEWIEEDGPSGEYVLFGNNPDGEIGGLIHEWNGGRLTVIVTEDEDDLNEGDAEDDWVIVPEYEWLKQYDNVYFSSEMGIVLRIISDSKYYIDVQAPKGVIREYFMKYEEH